MKGLNRGVGGGEGDKKNSDCEMTARFLFVRLERPMSLPLHMGCGMRALANQRRTG